MNKHPHQKFNRSFHFEIYAVGETIEKAILALAETLKWENIENIELQNDKCINMKPCEWYVRFTADTTSMKAAGEYVTGGVIVTWWK